MGRSRTSIVRISLFIFTVFLLTGCGGATGVKESLGLKKKSPDEFLVLSRPPLVVPPNFRLVPPSAPGVKDNNKIRNEAKESLYGRNDDSGGKLTRGEDILLKKAEVKSNEENIREIIRQENEENPKENLVELLVDPIRSENSEPIIDADKEWERINKNMAENKLITEGEIPVKSAENKGILNKIFD